MELILFDSDGSQNTLVQNEEHIVRKFLVFPLVAGLIAAVAGVSNAQTGQGCGGTVQSYQRFSYQPVQGPTGNHGNVVNEPVVSSPMGVNQLPQVNNSQVYRRYSYAPQAYYGGTSANYGSTTGHKKNLWEYAKGDPRRYRP